MRRPAALALALILVLGACMSGQDPTVEAGGGDTSGPGVSSLSTPGSPTTLPLLTPPISTQPVEERGYLTKVGAAALDGNPGGSRVVFEFDPVVPGYTIDYAEGEVTEDGSGDKVEVEGAAVLVVRFENSGGARIEGEDVTPTYTGPGRVEPTGAEGVVTEVVDAGDFEGVVTWAIGLRQRVGGFAATTLSNPSRLALDLVPS
ncbi:MAG: AMIN-like domain-containing (lipo)protein [Acidimicrobiales bacterium]